MKRLLAAACAAMLLTGALTACSSNRNNTPNTGNDANGTNTNPAGTAYTAPGQVRYPAGADYDRDSYNGMLTNRKYYDGTPDGRYTAYSDGTVAPGGNSAARDTYHLGTTGNNAGTLTGDVARGADDLVRGAGDAVDDIGTGIGNAARDITNCN